MTQRNTLTFTSCIGLLCVVILQYVQCIGDSHVIVAWLCIPRPNATHAVDDKVHMNYLSLIPGINITDVHAVN